MGRLTLNMLFPSPSSSGRSQASAFATRSPPRKKKGIWVGGVVPLGYRVVDRKLVVDELEAKTVRFIFDRYLELGSLGALIDELRQKGIVTRVRTLATGRSRWRRAVQAGTARLYPQERDVPREDQPWPEQLSGQACSAWASRRRDGRLEQFRADVGEAQSERPATQGAARSRAPGRQPRP